MHGPVCSRPFPKDPSIQIIPTLGPIPVNVTNIALFGSLGFGIMVIQYTMGIQVLDYLW